MTDQPNPQPDEQSHEAAESAPQASPPQAPPPYAAPQPAYPGPRRLTRSRADAQLGGVCAGLAEYFNLDPTLVRVLTVVAIVFTFPVGLLAYLVAWAIMPAD
jgi:phage shock protein PspC (stress-responsive transcriptional regulator)